MLAYLSCLLDGVLCRVEFCEGGYMLLIDAITLFIIMPFVVFAIGLPLFYWALIPLLEKTENSLNHIKDTLWKRFPVDFVFMLCIFISSIIFGVILMFFISLFYFLLSNIM